MLVYYDSKYNLFLVCTITFGKKIEYFAILIHIVAKSTPPTASSIFSPAGRAIKTERKLSVSLFAFNKTVVCVNNIRPTRRNTSSGYISETYFFKAAMLSSIDLILLSASACFLRSISMTLAGALLTKLSLLNFFMTEARKPCWYFSSS